MNNMSSRITRSAMLEQIPIAALLAADNPGEGESSVAATSGEVLVEFTLETEDVGAALVVEPEAVVDRASPRTVVLKPSGSAPPNGLTSAGG